MKPTLADEVIALALREKIEQCQEDIRTYMDGFEADQSVIDDLCGIVIRNFKAYGQDTIQDKAGI